MSWTEITFLVISVVQFFYMLHTKKNLDDLMEFIFRMFYKNGIKDLDVFVGKRDETDKE